MHSASSVPVRIAPTRVTFEASSMRPSTSMTPSSSRVRASASSAGGRSPLGATGSRYSLMMRATRRSAAVAVLPRADVAGGVEGQRAQRAGRAAGRDDPAGPGDEGPSRPGRDGHPQRVGALLGVGEDRVLLDRLVTAGDGLDDDGLLLAVPGQAHGGDPELLVDRRGERLEVVDV